MTRRVAFQGAPGAFSDDAARAVLGRSGETDGTTVPCTQFEDVFAAVRDGHADLGVVPVENTLAGSVQRTYDLLLERRLAIVGEQVLRIEHCLLGVPGSSVGGLDRVLSHPVALAQCRRFLAAHPGVRPTPTHDTAASVEMIMLEGDPSAGAVASRRSAKVYGAVVLADHLEDDPANFTRFLVVARPDDPHAHPPRATGDDRATKTSLVLTLANRPGALVEALQPMAAAAVDLVMIESRPLPGRPFEYAFYVDLAGHADDPAVATALGALSLVAQTVEVLGSYPRAAALLPAAPEPSAA